MFSKKKKPLTWLIVYQLVTHGAMNGMSFDLVVVGHEMNGDMTHEV